MAMGSVGKRKAERRGCQVKAQVLKPGGDPVDCVILDFSASGARVKLNAQVDLPSRFKLYIPSRPETKNVILRWIKGLEFGCEYSTGLADEKTFFELIDRVAMLEKAGDPDVLAEIARRIEALETRLERSIPVDGAKGGNLDEDRVAALERRIDEVADSAVARGEQLLAGRMGEMEDRLRAMLAPDVAGRLARLEAAAEAGAFAPPPGPDGATGPDPRIVARIADIEARVMSAPRAPAASVDVSALDARIEQTGRKAEERAERIERFLMTRMDDIEAQIISAPAAPAPVHSPEIADLNFRLHELAARVEELNAATPAPRAATFEGTQEIARLVERISDLEISVMELRLENPAGKPAEDSDLQRRIVEIEGRHAEIIGTLRNLLALLSATEGRRQAG